MVEGDHATLTSYCGLYCGDCVFGMGTVPDLARDLRKDGVDAWAEGKRWWYSPVRRK